LKEKGEDVSLAGALNENGLLAGVSLALPNEKV
jgi:hypothetical protein